MQDDQNSTENGDYQYDEDAEGHENQLEFDRDYATYDVLQKKGLINEELEEKIREDLERDSENGVLSADEQDKLVTKFLLKLVATPHPSEAFISRR